MPVIRMDSHTGHLVSSVAKLYQNSEATDCVLDAKGGFICAHKTILAACSPYMKKLVMNHGEMRIFSFKEVEHKIMKLILDIVYYGEVEVPSCSMALFMQTAKLLQITSLNITETFSKTNAGEQGSDNRTSSWGMKHSKNSERIPPVLQNGLCTNSTLLHEREDRSNSAFENNVEHSIHSSETEVSNIFEEVSVRMNKDHPMTAISNSEEVVGDRESSNGVSLQDEVNPFSFVAVPSVSVKSEVVDDEQCFPCITDVVMNNPLEDLPYDDRTNKVNVSPIQKFETESMVNAENKDVSSDMERLEDPSRRISSVMNQSLNELSTFFVDDVLTDSVPTSSSLFGRQQENNRDTDNTWISKYKLKKVRVVLNRIKPQPNSSSLISLQLDKNPESYSTGISKYKLKKSRVVLTRVEPIHTTSSIGNAVNEESSSLISLNQTLSNEGAEEEHVFSCIVNQQNGNQEINNASVSKLKPKDARDTLNSMKPLSEKEEECGHSGLKSSHCSSGTHEEMESVHVSDHTEENVSNVIQKGTSDSKYAAKSNAKYTSKEIFVCDFCHLSFISKESLRSHILSHTGKPLFSCDICQKYFAVMSNLKIHMRNHSEKRPYSCDICKETFSLKCNLSNHARVHSGDTPFSCDVCEASFTKKKYLKVHMRTHTGENSFSCNVGMASFNTKSNLQHQRIHSGQKPYSCDVCNASFNSKQYLKYHMRIHTGEKLFTCDVCAKSFLVKTSLVQHQRIHTGEKRYSCDVCNASFNSKQYLKYHMRIHTGEKLFTCDVCAKSFLVKTSLVQHQRIHTGEKPYPCYICKVSFRQLTALNNHTRLHTGEKPFSCNVCGASFRQKSNLLSHQRTHTGKRTFSF